MSGIINISRYTDALRNTGYKNTESALAEIVDNSLEAEAKDVLIICKLATNTGRKIIREIAILDNGFGMDNIALQDSLVIGEGTRRDRKGMGRFGVGLPQASLHVTPRVEVYSWQNECKPLMVYLDIEKIKKGEQTEIETPIESTIQKIYEKYIYKYSIANRTMSFGRSGTMVVWKNCDRLTPKTIGPLFERFRFLLGRKYRHFISEADCAIGLSIIHSEEFDELLKPNDPLYLKKDNIVLGDRSRPKDFVEGGEPIFELWGNGDVLGTIKIPVKYYDSASKLKKSDVEVTFSWAKEEFQKAGGENNIGKHCKKNVGISVVRAKREIDFGKFDLFEDVNEPQHRWWGCEIRFNPELDETFGVSNNKQQVELFEVNPNDYEEEEIKPIWIVLHKIITKEIKNIYKNLGSRKKGSRTKDKGVLTEESIVTTIEKDSSVSTSSKHVKATTPEDKLKELVRKKLIEGGTPDPSEDTIKVAMENVVKLEYRDIGDNSTFIDISMRMGNCWLTINTGSIFYRDLYAKIEEKGEDVKRAFNLILMAFARAEDEAYHNKNLCEAFTDVREEWGKKLRKYLESDYQA